MSTFSIRLRSLRKQHRETQDDVSKFLGIQRTTFSGYERGVIVPPFEKMVQLAEHYRVTVSYLTGQSNNETYDIKKTDEFPDIYEQLIMISNELLSDTVVVKCKGIVISNEEKKQIETFVENVAKYIEVMVKNR